MDLGLAGKTVIVTGGASHIGRAITLNFAREGSAVILADIDEEQAKKTAALAKNSPGKVIVVKTDVTVPAQCEAMVKQALDSTGRLDVLVNDAGWLRFQLFINKSRADLEKEVNVNYWGVVNTMSAVMKHMMAQKSGKIVNIASRAAKVGAHLQSNYAAAKAANIALTKSLARELGRYKINVNAVCPGVTIPSSTDEIGKDSFWRLDGLYDTITPEWREKTTKGFPLGRLGLADDIAKLVLFLASDAASWITGQAFSADGGFTMA